MTQQPNPPQAVYDALSNADKEVVNAGILGWLMNESLQAAEQIRQGVGVEAEKTAFIETLHAINNNLRTSASSEASTMTEMDIESNRALIAEDPEQLQAARAEYAQLREDMARHGNPLGGFEATRLTNNLIAVDGDQVSEADLQARLPDLRRERRALLDERAR